MKCWNHPDEEAAHTCLRCGNAICAKCLSQNPSVCIECSKNDIQPEPTGFVPGKLMKGFAIYCLIAVSAYFIVLFVFPFLGKVTFNTAWWINIALRFIISGISMWALILFLRRGYIRYVALVAITIIYHVIDIGMGLYVLINFKGFETMGMGILGVAVGLLDSMSVLLFFIIYSTNHREYVMGSMDETKRHDTNWTRRHLNICMGLSWVPAILIILFTPYAGGIPGYGVLGFASLFFIFFVHVWGCRQKRRSWAWAFFTFIPIVGSIVPILLRNKTDQIEQQEPNLVHMSPGIVILDETAHSHSDVNATKTETKECPYCHANVPTEANWCSSCSSAL